MRKDTKEYSAAALKRLAYQLKTTKSPKKNTRLLMALRDLDKTALKMVLLLAGYTQNPIKI